MKKGLTEIVFVLDKSGSMAELENDTIGGFNSLIQKQKSETGEALVSTILFSSRSMVLHDRIPLDQVQPMTNKEYQAGGCTALLDAVGGAIHHIGSIHKYARPEDVPEKTLFVITTDGEENASCTYTLDKIRTMIKRQREKYGWEFLFLGANIDAVKTAGNLGIASERAITYQPDSRGTDALYRSVSMAMSCMRSANSLSDEWRQELEEDNRR